MPNPYFILFELNIYLQLALGLRHAWKHGNANLLRLLSGIIFGVTLELASIRQLHPYQYGQFLIMILDVPLCIGIIWGRILLSNGIFRCMQPAIVILGSVAKVTISNCANFTNLEKR